jgi:hypothetical protein
MSPNRGFGEDASKPQDNNGKDRCANRHVERKPIHRRHSRSSHRADGNGNLHREGDHGRPMQQTNAEEPAQARDILSNL